MNNAFVLAVVAACLPAAAVAQYPLTPSPALDLTKLSSTVTPSGYGAARQTLRADTNTFSVTQARLTLQMRPLPIAAFRMQANFAAIDSSTGTTQPSFALTDAYVQLSPPESSVAYRRFSPALLVGQFKTPFSLEYLTSASLLLTANRSQAADSLAPHRDIGIMGQVQAWTRVMLAAAVVNGAGSNHPSDPSGKELVTGRLTLVPLSQTLAVAAKWSDQGGDHRWGADVLSAVRSAASR